MFFILSKILLFLLSPIIWIFTLLVWSVLTKNHKRKRTLLITTVVIFYLFSNTFILDEFVRAYEERNETYSELTVSYDVAIVLGGFSGYDSEQEIVQFHTATDRLMAGIKLYKTGIAKKIMISSGSGSILKPKLKEALFIKDYLITIGIPEEDLIIESESKNTRENAVNSAKILNKEYPNGKFILVTSATHMPRAKRCFQKVGLKITPFSVDHKSGPRKYVLDHLLLPNPICFVMWLTLTKEWTGFIVYKFTGYI
tara:strand:- start:8586 stop:9350 length:765 start_codon:yes stop_codon:yes gene_type:complete